MVSVSLLGRGSFVLPHFLSFQMGAAWYLHATSVSFCLSPSFWRGFPLFCVNKQRQHETNMLLPFLSFTLPITRGYLFPMASTNEAAWNQYATSISLCLPPWSREVFFVCSIDKWGATWNWHPLFLVTYPPMVGVCFSCILVSVY